MAQRTILMLGQHFNTAWNHFSSPPASKTWYGPIQGAFFQNANFTAASDGSGTGTTGGGVAECAFACVLSLLFHTVGPILATGTTLTTNVNVGGPVAAAAAQSGVGKGNLAVATPPTANGNFAYWYDATDIDAIPSGQQIGGMQTLTASASAPVNPALGVVCDSVDQGFCSTFVFATLGGGAGSGINSGPAFCRLGGAGNNGGAGPAGSQTVFTNDFCANAFVASWLQWQPGVNTDSTHNNLTCKLATGATNTLVSPGSSLGATIQSAGFTGLNHDTTDILAVPAGNFSGYIWTGTTTSGLVKVGNHGVHMRPAANNATMIFSGTAATSGGATWSGVNTTYTTFGGIRADNLVLENMTSIPTAGVFNNLSFQTASATYGGSPLSATVQNGPNTGDTGAGTGTISTNSGANFVNTSLSVGGMTTPSTWFFDTTDIAAFLPFNGYLLAVTSASASGSSGSLPFTGFSINFTAPAHLGLTTTGAG